MTTGMASRGQKGDRPIPRLYGMMRLNGKSNGPMETLKLATKAREEVEREKIKAEDKINDIGHCPYTMYYNTG